MTYFGELIKMLGLLALAACILLATGWSVFGSRAAPTPEPVVEPPRRHVRTRRPVWDQEQVEAPEEEPIEQPPPRRRVSLLLVLLWSVIILAAGVWVYNRFPAVQRVTDAVIGGPTTDVGDRVARTPTMGPIASPSPGMPPTEDIPRSAGDDSQSTHEGESTGDGGQAAPAMAGGGPLPFCDQLPQGDTTTACTQREPASTPEPAAEPTADQAAVDAWLAAPVSTETPWPTATTVPTEYVPTFRAEFTPAPECSPFIGYLGEQKAKCDAVFAQQTAEASQ